MGARNNKNNFWYFSSIFEIIFSGTLKLQKLSFGWSLKVSNKEKHQIVCAMRGQKWATGTGTLNYWNKHRIWRKQKERTRTPTEGENRPCWETPATPLSQQLWGSAVWRSGCDAHLEADVNRAPKIKSSEADTEHHPTLRSRSFGCEYDPSWN